MDSSINLRINMRTLGWNSGAAVACVFALLLACFPDASTSLELSLNERTRNTLRVRCENLGAVVAGASLQLNTTTPPADCFSVTHTDSNSYMTLNFTTSCEGTLLDNCSKIFAADAESVWLSSSDVELESKTC